MKIRKKINLILSICIMLMLSGCKTNNDFVKETDTHQDNEILTAETTNDNLATIYYFDVGQADCTLIVSGEDTMLIDTGDIETSDKVIQYLSDVGIVDIDYLVLTHPHSDHIGGAPDIINNYNINNILMPNKTTTSKIFEKTLDAIEENGYNITIPEQNTTYNIGYGTFTILSDQTIDWGDDLNDSSIILRVEFGETSFMFSGDATEKVEESILNVFDDISSTVLKVGHHGSYTSTSNLYLSAISPTYGIISCGKDNEYGHPHEVTLNKLEDLNVQYYRTDELGTIIVQTDGKSVTFNSTPSSNKNTDNKDNVFVDETTYVLNTNSKKIHLPDCIYAEQISQSNKEIFSGDINELLSNGYSTCKVCIE